MGCQGGGPHRWLGRGQQGEVSGHAWLASLPPHTTLLRFVLLSESDIPLYDPLTFWTQLMAMEKSRINACKLKNHESKAHLRRWSDRMETTHLRREHWRKVGGCLQV